MLLITVVPRDFGVSLVDLIRWRSSCSDCSCIQVSGIRIRMWSGSKQFQDVRALAAKKFNPIIVCEDYKEHILSSGLCGVVFLCKEIRLEWGQLKDSYIEQVHGAVMKHVDKRAWSVKLVKKNEIFSDVTEPIIEPEDIMFRCFWCPWHMWDGMEVCRPV